MEPAFDSALMPKDEVEKTGDGQYDNRQKENNPSDIADFLVGFLFGLQLR